MQADPKPYEVGFTSTLDWPAGQVVFQVGGAPDDWRFCVDDVSVHTGELPAPFEQETATRVRVNQLGYVLTGPKRASLVTEQTRPRCRGGCWTRRATCSRRGRRSRGVRTGPRTRTCRSSTFSELDVSGEGFTLVADGESSHPFDITADLYQDLRTDSMRFFYTNRSGTAIDGAVAGAEYARPAGHVGVAPNQGDVAVPCQEPRPGWTAGPATTRSTSRAVGTTRATTASTW